MGTKVVYLKHSIMQGCGWVKVQEMACRDDAQADQREANIRAQFPQDVVRFERRTVQHSMILA